MKVENSKWEPKKCSVLWTFNGYAILHVMFPFIGFRFISFKKGTIAINLTLYFQQYFETERAFHVVGPLGNTSILFKGKP